MTADVPPALLRAVHELAVGLLPGHLDVGTAVQLAEALVATGRADQPTVEAACLSRRATRADADPVVREMLAAYGIRVPEVPTDDDAYRAAALAFGWWDLPVTDFASAFYRRLPARNGQEPLDGRIVALLDEREHEPWVLSEERERVESRLRATVRAAFPVPGR